MSVVPCRITPAVVQFTQVLSQVVLYAGLLIFAQYFVSWLHLPLPASLVGMTPVLVLIVRRILPLQWARVGAYWLLAKMLLFFAPTVVAMVSYTQLLLVDGWRIFAVITLNTVMVLGTTVWTMEKVYRYETRRLNRG